MTENVVDCSKASPDNSENPFLRFLTEKITSLCLYFHWSSVNFVCNE
jgi:hypothetical protein